MHNRTELYWGKLKTRRLFRHEGKTKTNLTKVVQQKKRGVLCEYGRCSLLEGSYNFHLSAKPIRLQLQNGRYLQQLEISADNWLLKKAPRESSCRNVPDGSHLRRPNFPKIRLVIAFESRRPGLRGNAHHESQFSGIQTQSTVNHHFEREKEKRWALQNDEAASLPLLAKHPRIAFLVLNLANSDGTHVWVFLYKQCTRSLPLFQRNKQTHEVGWRRALCQKLFHIPSTSCVCLLRWKRGKELVPCLYKKPRHVYQPLVGLENPKWW